MTNDHAFIQHALNLARRGLGRTAPNPAVGALIVKDGQVIAAARTADGGRPHAETLAIAEAGTRAQGATLYATLEPCCHRGATPPCTEAIIAAGISRVAVACQDADPRMQGKGIAALRKAGIEVAENICTAEAQAINAGFFSVIQRGRPFVTIKIASTSDGFVADAKGKSKWITGEKARAYGHLLRAAHDAILTGIGTALADDPALTCRLPGREAHSPIRIVMDSQLQLPPTSQLVQTAREVPLWVMTTAEAAQSPKCSILESWEVRIIALDSGKMDVAHALNRLAKEGITRLLVEAGPRLTSAVLEQALADRLYWFRAPASMGSGIAALTPGAMKKYGLARARPAESRIVGDDRLDVYSL